MNVDVRHFDPDQLDWSKGCGLLPAIVQHVGDGRVLMLGYMNREALEASRESGRVTFYSRSRQCLWTKGETSGNFLRLCTLLADCDQDSLLVLAEPEGPVCHTETASCFGNDGVHALAFVGQLDALVAQRQAERPKNSYTTRLLDAGTRRIAQKVGEEAVETALAAVAQGQDALIEESADLLYHLLVLLHDRGLSLGDVAKCLRARHG